MKKFKDIYKEKSEQLNVIKLIKKYLNFAKIEDKIQN